MFYFKGFACIERRVLRTGRSFFVTAIDCFLLMCMGLAFFLLFVEHKHSLIMCLGLLISFKKEYVNFFLIFGKFEVKIIKKNFFLNKRKQFLNCSFLRIIK